ncbi:MAG: hypothetical protein JOZ55_03010 [Alphaproteobacteria bacterium]|nr:hypothetical protein [Alphaproteobacteria bacterium]
MSKRARIWISTALAALCAVSGAQGAPVCLESFQIRNTTIVDPRTILFHMNNGTTWRNTLKNACPDLTFHGFVYVLHGLDEVCDNAVAIRVLESGEICLLGQFTREPPPAHT